MIYDWLKTFSYYWLIVNTLQNITKQLTLGTKIAIIRWANAGILSAVLLVEVDKWR